jgi:hypothetical protein
MISHNALKHLAALNNAIGRRRWTAAFRAAHQLDMLEQAEAGQPVDTGWSCSITNLRDWRALRRQK